ncbi:hypothetical protein FNF31_01189 [Cafeteria roenbergensis]|uniref:Uncharacterized protein n=1 Tax=Cafeteria roenbergensis TaxID=33653 RepID=A0A5A8DPZ6_CAFRO|nr:hypothetical protein FNF31_01189 [Cafeteria roenbergensis]
MLRVARLADADPRVASLAGVLHDALAAEGTPAAARAVSQLRLFLGNGLASRVVPSVKARKSKRRPGKGKVLQRVRRLLRGASARVAQGSLAPDADLRAGTVLLSNAVAEAPGRAVFVLLGAESRDKDPATGRELVTFRALCVNRPLPATVAEVLPDLQVGPLRSGYLFFGGADDEGVYILHPHAALPGATQLADDGSLAAGVAIADAAAALQDGEAQAAEFKVVRGSTLLHYDVEADDFVEAPGALAVRGDAVAGLALAPALLEGSARHRGDANAWYEHDKFFHQDVVWREAMTRLSGDCPSLAEMHPSVVEMARAAMGAADAPEEDPEAVADGAQARA